MGAEGVDKFAVISFKGLKEPGFFAGYWGIRGRARSSFDFAQDELCGALRDPRLRGEERKGERGRYS